jgi:hypothetical protein
VGQDEAHVARAHVAHRGAPSCSKETTLPEPLTVTTSSWGSPSTLASAGDAMELASSWRGHPGSGARVRPSTA